MLDFTAIADKPWPFVRGYLTKALDLGDRLDGVSDDYAIGYLSKAMRLDLKSVAKERKCTPGKTIQCGNVCRQPKNCKPKAETPVKQQSKAKTKAVPKSKTGSVAEISPDGILVDPKRFQYKVLGEHTKTGEVGSLAGVRRYDPNLAGIVQVWEDPADGQTYVVNGHNRLALAKRLGAESVTVRYLNVKDAAEARAVGALTNIAEGRGNAVDAAKFFKDTGLSKSDVEAKGIPMREKIASDGLALSNLEDSLFRKVIDGDMPQERAVIIGQSSLDHTEQRSLVDLIDQQEKRKRKITNDVVKELVDTVKSSTSKTEEQFDLFGGSQVTQNLAIEKASLQATIKQRLSREKKLFGTVARSKAAQELEKAGNIIDVESSEKMSKSAAVTLGVFDQLKNLSGPVSSAINRAAERISNGESSKKVQDDLYQEILNDLPNVLGVKKSG